MTANTPSKCRSCGSSKLRLGLDLGVLPLANSFLPRQRALDPAPELRYPLRVFFCSSCHLIQLLDIVDRSAMYKDYAFLTSTARTSLVHFKQYADEVARRVSMRAGDLVVDVGSNDGTLLKEFSRHGAKVMGVEPARNVADIAIAAGVDTLVEYFGLETVQRLGAGNARIITANNVVSHVGDLNALLKNVSELLGKDGVFVFEVPWVVDVLRHYNFDIIYHEHLSYFGFKPLSQLFERHELELFDLQHFPDIHGGTLRGYAARRGNFPRASNMLNRIFQDEEKYAAFDSLLAFADHTQEFRAKLVELLTSLRRDGKTIVGYGAPAKATILLNYCKIDRSLLDFVLDTTPFKQGRFIPGVRIPIVSPAKFREYSPDYALLLAWNFKDEILNKEQNFLKRGGKFIVPFPMPSIIGQDSNGSVSS